MYVLEPARDWLSNIADQWGFTVLHWAAYVGNSDATAMLLLAGADVDITDYDGATPKDVALENGYIEIAEMLTNFA